MLFVLNMKDPPEVYLISTAEAGCTMTLKFAGESQPMHYVLLMKDPPEALGMKSL